jgi:hypothetical protein
VAKTQEPYGNQPDPDLLAAVVLHTLVTEGREGFTPARVALACERDPNIHADMEETEAALTLLVDDGLAECQDGLYRPTRAAVRASELSF